MINMDKEDQALIEKAENSPLLPGKKRRKPSEEDMKIMDLIVDLLPVMSALETAKAISKKLDKKISVERVKSLRDRIEEENRSKFMSLTSVKVAVEARTQYQKLAKEGWRLVLEAEMEPEVSKRVEMKARALNTIRLARESEDRLYKLCGLHKEDVDLGYEEILRSESWKKFQSVILLWIRYDLKEDPQRFLDFMEKLSQDKDYIDTFLSYHARRNAALKKNQWRAGKLMEGEYVDTEQIIEVDE